MRKLSIVTLISTFFALILIALNGAFVMEYQRQVNDLNFFTFQRFTMVMRMMHETGNESKSALSSWGVRISEMPKQSLYEGGIVLMGDHFSDMILYEKKLYFVPRPPPDLPKFTNEGPPILEDISHFSLYRLWILCGVVNFLLVLFFSIVLKKLLRLRNLKSAIHSFGDTKKFSPIAVDSEDELGEIATEFNHAMEKVHLLKEARTLFLRNILHELKTPIMKGKILSSGLENNKQQTQLERIFERLEALVGEMVKVEKLSSNEWILEPMEYRLVDVLDHALDLLLLNDTKRIHIVSSQIAPLINVDFELFATAIKNLLDNALKHSTQEVEIVLEQGFVRISSWGEKIAKERLDFSRAFNRSVEGASTGLGLGLYIANAIVIKHKFHLDYVHLDGKNKFTVYFKSVEA